MKALNRFLSIKLLVGASLIGLANVAWADNCDTARNDFDEFYCKDKLYAQADADLNTAYKSLMGMLKPSAKSMLKSTQLAWIRERDDACVERKENELVLYVNCRLNRTVSRTEFLQARIRECKSTGCQPSRLSSE